MIKNLLFVLIITFSYSSFSQKINQDEIDDLLEEFILEEDEDLLDDLLRIREQKHYIYPR